MTRGATGAARLRLNLMAASLPAGPGVSRRGQRPPATRRAEERGLDTPGPAGSHLTMRFKGRGASEDAHLKPQGRNQTSRAMERQNNLSLTWLSSDPKV